MNKRLRHTLTFEDDVRRVAEAVWRLEPGGVQPAWYRGDPVLRELDGIARLPDVTHLLMATTSTRLDKVKDDVEKLNRAERKEKTSGLDTKKWLITEQQLNAEHIRYATRSSVETITLAQFRDRFFNGREYISKRRTGMFGSSRNLRDGSISIPEDEYVDLPMVVVSSDDSAKEQLRKDISIDEIVGMLQDGEIIVITGPFGAGKSLTTRQIFLSLVGALSRGKSAVTPIAINLREHWGALYGDEILERHARGIGFLPRETLTVAWRAGIAHLLLDGFDEVATQALVRPSDKNFMKRVRYEALQAVRDLVTNTPSGVGLLICGRDHYFDNMDELRNALGLTRRQFFVVSLGEFTEEKAREFLSRYASTDILPDWLPRKPLLLGYLAHQNLLDQVLGIDAGRGFGFVWDSFLRLICEREAEHTRAAMDPGTIRRVLERLACIARASASGNGAITGIDLAEAYRAETGDTPGEGVIMQLQRLPGLTQREQDPTARSFVDPDLLAALQGSAVARSVAEMDTGLAERNWSSGLNRVGLQMASYMLECKSVSAPAVFDFARRISNRDNTRQHQRQLAVDAALVGIELSTEEAPIDGKDLRLSDGNIPILDLENKKISNVTFRNCGIDEMSVGEGLANSSVRFERCIIMKINGVPSEQGLPTGMFSNCEFAEFDNASTNAAILRLDMPPGLKALMTVLRKLYMQAGAGRKVGALKRGIPLGGDVYSHIDAVLQLLERERMISIFGQVAHPVRRHAFRVHQILAAGAMSQDPLVLQVKNWK